MPQPAAAGDATVLCRNCGERLAYTSEIAGGNEMAPGVRIEVYACTCGRKSVIVHEPPGGLSEKAQTWVEREVARTGAFFPQDYIGGGPGGGRFGR